MSQTEGRVAISGQAVYLRVIEILARTQKATLDVRLWMEWFLAHPKDPVR